MREWEIGAVENIHGALPYIRFAPILALVGVGVNRIGKDPSLQPDYASILAVSPILFLLVCDACKESHVWRNHPGRVAA